VPDHLARAVAGWGLAPTGKRGFVTAHANKTPSNIIYLFPPTKPRYACLIRYGQFGAGGNLVCRIAGFDLVAAHALVEFGIKNATSNLLILARF
jgi:hypothetical protein